METYDREGGGMGGLPPPQEEVETSSLLCTPANNAISRRKTSLNIYLNQTYLAQCENRSIWPKKITLQAFCMKK